MLNIYKSVGSAAFPFSFFPFNQVKGNFILMLALASNNLSVNPGTGIIQGPKCWEGSHEAVCGEGG